MAKSKTKKRKNSDYKASSVTPVAEKKPEKKSTLARAQDRAEKRQKN